MEMVYGPPGTGKTSEILQRIGDQVKIGKVDPKHIGFFSFTRAAAQEALSRMGLRESNNVSTLHALAFRRTHASRAQIVDRRKLDQLGVLTGLTFNNTADPLSEGDELMAVMSCAAAKKMEPQVVADMYFPTVDHSKLEFLDQTYQNWKSQNGYVDFNDLLHQARTLDFSDLRIAYIDEGQDLSPLQWDVVDNMYNQGVTIVVAGDDDQCLYEWAGADPHGMSDRQSQKHVLEQSYRVPRSVFDLATTIVGGIGQRESKEYRPRGADGLVEWVPDLTQAGVDPTEDTLILIRNHFMRADVEEQLIRDRVPYTTNSGWGSPLQTRKGRAVRTWMRMKRGMEVRKEALQHLIDTVVEERVQERLRAHDFSVVQTEPWDLCLGIYDAEVVGYLSDIDLEQEPRVRLSTIHGSKGSEAHHVVLVNGMGSRTFESIADAEYRVWYVAVTRTKERLTIVEAENPMLAQS